MREMITCAEPLHRGSGLNSSNSSRDSILFQSSPPNPLHFSSFHATLPLPYHPSLIPFHSTHPTLLQLIPANFQPIPSSPLRPFHPTPSQPIPANVQPIPALSTHSSPSQSIPAHLTHPTPSQPILANLQPIPAHSAHPSPSQPISFTE